VPKIGKTNLENTKELTMKTEVLHCPMLVPFFIVLLPGFQKGRDIQAS
jgi:hypothetical protein